jgi:ABC-2 type transport system permease protein
MRNALLVIKEEIRHTAGKPSFWITALVFPLIILAITFGSQLLAQGWVDDTEGDDLASLISGGAAPGEQKPIGYVDHAGVISALPDGLPAGLVQPYETEAAAAEAMISGAIEQYYVVPEDLLEKREIVLIQQRFSPFEQLGGTNLFQYLVIYNLATDADAAVLLLNPVPSVVSEALLPETDAPTATGSPGGIPGSSVAAMGMLFIFFFVLTMSSGFMLRSVTKEKENRVVEILLSSIDPRELMLGKIVGLGAVALLQMAIWLGGGLLLLRQDSPLLGLASAMTGLSLPVGFVAWAILYFLLGYMTFASALGAVGTLAPTMREASQFTFAVLLPLMIPIWMNTAFMEAPNGPLVTFLSIFPLTSPVSMVARMVAVTVPLWQLVLSLALLAVTTYGFVLLSARFFKADTLLSLAPLDFRRLRTEVWAKLRRPDRS